MKRKNIILLLLAAIVGLLLSSCSIGGTGAGGTGTGGSDSSDTGTGGSTDTGSGDVGDSGSGDSTDEDTDPQTEYIFAPGEDLTLVIGEGALTEANYIKLDNALKAKRRYTLWDGVSEAGEHEIIVGRCDRELSRIAYKLLDRQSRESSLFGGYVIYSDGSSVAVAYDDTRYFTTVCEDAAIAVFVDEYLSKAERGYLVIPRGRREDVSFDTVKYQRVADRELVESLWAVNQNKLKELYGEELAAATVEAFKGMYSLYEESGVIDWYADLYDREVGGFYYSNSARNSEGYLPDLESTNQVLGFLGSSGVARGIEGGYIAMLSENMKADMVAWVKGLQDRSSGYFYHPQWGKQMTDRYISRRGRDCQWAEEILTKFGAKPTYNTPNGVVGDGIPAGESVAPVSITGRLGGGVKPSVSAVAAANSDAGVSKHLLNKNNFLEYLATLDINGSSYGVGNTLESQAKEIVMRDKVLKARGERYSLTEILYEWMCKHQNTETGLWTLDGSKDDYAINGLLKIASTYTKIGKPFPNLALAAQASLECLAADTDPEHVCCVLNPWYAITILFENAESFASGEIKEELLSEISEMKKYIAENAPALIGTTTKKLAKFRKSDGSFSYYQDQSAYASQGMPTAVPGTNEGDVNATTICILSIPGHIFQQLGINRVPICTAADRIVFLNTLEEQGYIVKERKNDYRDDANGKLYQNYGGECYETNTAKGLDTVLRSDYYIVYDVGFDYYEDGNKNKYKQEFINLKQDEVLGSTVLEYGKSKEAGYYRGIYLTSTRSAGSCYAFESEIKIDTLSEAAINKISTEKLPFVAEIKLAHITEKTAQENNINECFDTVARIYLVDAGNGEYSLAFGAAVPAYAYGENVLSPTFGIGDWVTVAFEVFDNGYARYYLNNEPFCEMLLLDDPTVLENTDAVRLALSSNATDSAVHIDYTFTGKLNKNYKTGDNLVDTEADVFKAGSYYDSLGGMTYGSQQSSDSESFFRASWYGIWGSTLTNDPYLLNTQYKREGIAMVDGTDKDGNPSRIFEYSKGAKPDYYNGIYYGLNSEYRSGAVYVLETDFKLGTISTDTLAKIGEGGCLMDITLAKLVAISSGDYDINESVLTVGGIYLEKNEQGKYYWQLTSKRGDGEGGFGMELSTNKWYTLTLEVYSDGTVKYFVDGVAMGDRAHAVEPARLAESNVLRLSLTECAVASSVRLDNTFFGKVEKEYRADADFVPAPPTPPTEPENPDTPDEPSEDKIFDGEYVAGSEWT